jgi:hypothetical protein
MRKITVFLLLSVHLVLTGYSQDFHEVPLSNSERKSNVIQHYQYASEDGHVAIIDLILFKNKTYKYQNNSNVYSAHSKGKWSIHNNILTLNSDFQQDQLPIKVYYRTRNTSDAGIKKIAYVKDMMGNVADYALIHVNNDSTLCSYGDAFCDKEIDRIDSLKVVLENGLRSQWIAVPQATGILQVVLLSAESLEHYSVLTNQRYKIGKGVLKSIAN